MGLDEENQEEKCKESRSGKSILVGSHITFAYNGLDGVDDRHHKGHL
jgi:hypothetical protein